MNLKLRRLVRTPYSEQYALFDLDAASDPGQENDELSSIGKLDLHFTENGVFGTVLLWQSAASSLPVQQRQAFIEALLSDISQPMGMPDTFAVEFFSPDVGSYALYHNLGAENDGES